MQGLYRASSPFKNYWEYDGEFDTRYFGGTTTKYQTDITSLAKGITMAGIKKMEYILFDNCYMSSIEVAYELRNVTNYLIASPTEIMAYGMPYAVVGEYLFGKTNYKAVCNGFYSFYSTYGWSTLWNIGRDRLFRTRFYRIPYAGNQQPVYF